MCITVFDMFICKHIAGTEKSASSVMVAVLSAVGD